MAGDYTYDPESTVGRVRLYIDDRDVSNCGDEVPLRQRSAIFSDQEIDAFITDEGGDTLGATSRALMAIANNKSLLVQRRDIDGVSVDYGSLRADLMKAASEFRSMAAGGGVPADGYAEVAYTDFGARRIVVNSELRGIT